MGLMTTLGGLIGGATATGISETLDGVGKAAVNIRSAITGDLPPEKKAELEIHLADIDVRLSEAQNKVNEIEAGSVSFFVAGARPAIMWICAASLAYTFLLQPFLAWGSVNFGWLAPPTIDTGSLMTLLLGVLGLGTMRSYEKVNGVHNDH